MINFDLESSQARELHSMVMRGEPHEAIITALCEIIGVHSNPDDREKKILTASRYHDRVIEVVAGAFYAIVPMVVLFIPFMKGQASNFMGLVVREDSTIPYRVLSFAPPELCVSLYLDLDFSDIISEHGYDVPDHARQVFHDRAIEGYPCAACFRGQLGGGMDATGEALNRYFLTRNQLDEMQRWFEKYLKP